MLKDALLTAVFAGGTGLMIANPEMLSDENIVKYRAFFEKAIKMEFTQEDADKLPETITKIYQDNNVVKFLPPEYRAQYDSYMGMVGTPIPVNTDVEANK